MVAEEAGVAGRAVSGQNLSALCFQNHFEHFQPGPARIFDGATGSKI
jgi:hypothetical protein